MDPRTGPGRGGGSGRRPGTCTASLPARGGAAPGRLPPPSSGAAASTLPTRLEPQLPTLVKEAPRGDGWIQELKFDGYRILKALLVGSREDEGNLIYRGRVGTGPSAGDLAGLRNHLDELPAHGAPFHNLPTGAAARGVHWVRPGLVVDVTFGEWTDGGLLRHASFKGVQAVSSPKKKNSNRSAGVELSNAGRIL